MEGTRKYSRLLTEISNNIRRGPSGLTKPAVAAIAARLASWNKSNYDVKMRPGGWRSPSWRTLVFSRELNYFAGIPNPSMSQIEAKANSTKSLIDREGAGRGYSDTLYKGVTDSTNKNFRVSIRRNAIVIGTDVPYADKHLFGKSQSFEFGSTEKARLKQRVPPPPASSLKSSARKRLKKKIGSEEFRRRQQNDRAYYVIFNWAKKKYPITKTLPHRSWIVKIPEDIRSFFSDVIQKDFMASARAKSGFAGGGFASGSIFDYIHRSYY